MEIVLKCGNSVFNGNVIGLIEELKEDASFSVF